MKEYMEFMEEYAGFFEDLEKKQEEKLQALTGKELTQIEASIVVQQAMNKQIANMEQRRITLQSRMGMEDKTFREVMAYAGEGDREALQGLYERLGRSMDTVKHLNEKCMQIAQSALVRMGALPSGERTRNGQDYGTQTALSGAILETKI